MMSHLGDTFNSHFLTQNRDMSTSADCLTNKSIIRDVSGQAAARDANSRPSTSTLDGQDAKATLGFISGPSANVY